MEKNARHAATEILLRILQNDSFSNIVMDNELNALKKQNQTIKQHDISFVSRLVYGVLERKISLDYVIEKHCNVRINRLHPVVLMIMRVGCYQLLYMDKVPPSAAVNESVNLAYKMKQKPSVGMINAVLRAIEKNRYDVFEDLPKGSYGLGIKTSFPKKPFCFGKMYTVRRFVRKSHILHLMLHQIL